MAWVVIDVWEEDGLGELRFDMFSTGESECGKGDERWGVWHETFGRIVLRRDEKETFVEEGYGC